MLVRNAVIFGLLALLIWFGVNIVRLERYHYANSLHFCAEHTDPVQKDRCLKATETRTHWGYHLAYGLRLL